ncbi:MAG: hypothetical protein ACI9S8_001348 [Chlamydiales bacterium]|jgi:hypothetical protein
MTFITPFDSQNLDIFEKLASEEGSYGNISGLKGPISECQTPSHISIKEISVQRLIEETAYSLSSSHQPRENPAFSICTDTECNKESSSRSPTRILIESLNLDSDNDSTYPNPVDSDNNSIYPEPVDSDNGSAYAATVCSDNTESFGTSIFSRGLKLPMPLSLPNEEETDIFFKPSKHIQEKGPKSPQEVLENILHLTPKGLISISSILKEKHLHPTWLVSAAKSINQVLKADKILNNSEFGKNHISGATSTRPIKFFDESLGEIRTVAVLKIPVDLRGRPLMKEPRSGISNHELPGRERMPAALGMTRFLNIPESFIISLPGSLFGFENSFRNIPCTIIQFLEGSKNLYQVTVNKTITESTRINEAKQNPEVARAIAFNTVMQKEIVERGLDDKELRKVALTHAIFASTDGDMQNTLMVANQLFSIDFSLNLPKKFKDPIKSWILDVDGVASQAFDNEELLMIKKNLNWNSMKLNLNRELPYLDGDNIEKYLDAPTIKTLYITSQTVKRAAQAGFSARQILEFLDFSSHFNTAFASKAMTWYNDAEDGILHLKGERENLSSQYSLNKQIPKNLGQDELIEIRKIRDCELQDFQKIIDAFIDDAISPN